MRRQIGGRRLLEWLMETVQREAGLEKVQGQLLGCPSDLKKGREREGCRRTGRRDPSVFSRAGEGNLGGIYFPVYPQLSTHPLLAFGLSRFKGRVF